MDSTKPKIQWLGHAGFRIKFQHEGTERTVYIDPWIGNPKCPEDFKLETAAEDADLILISHGHFDHASSAPDIVKNAKKDCKIACIYEIGQYYKEIAKVAEDRLLMMNKSGTNDLGWCKITMVSADHSSSCGFH